jgi:predicted PurR-regulated permease PerM
LDGNNAVAKNNEASRGHRALIALTGTVIGVVAVAALYWAQSIFIPLALAIYLAFLLNPVVRFVQRSGIGRTISVIVVCLFAALVLGGVGWLVASQAKSLLVELPNYSANIRDRLQSIRQLGNEVDWDKLMRELNGVFKSQPSDSQPADDETTAIVLKPTGNLDWLAKLPAYIGSMAESLGGLALTIILVVFMLVKREELRNRFIRLVGLPRLSYTTKAVDDVGQRVSRFLLMQAIINAGFGCALAVGMFLIGIPYAALWGLLAGLLRFVPYIGVWVAMLFPITLSLAAFSGWWLPLATIAIFLILELIAANVMEPWLFGRSMGISEVAILISAAFWVFLWGPVGLLLSTPLTGCLLVLGKYVPQLGFLDLLLGEGPALDADVCYYQRLLARDQDEATDRVLEWIEESGPEGVYDAVLVPALSYSVRDRERGELTEDDENFVLKGTSEILEDLGERFPTAGPRDSEKHGEANSESLSPPVRILGCPARGEQDCLALQMLIQVLDPTRWAMEITPVEALTAEVVTRVAEEAPAVVCIGSLPPGGLAHTRYICKRLRTRVPEVKIVVGRWGSDGNSQRTQKQFAEAGADFLTTSILETRNQVEALHPLLADSTAIGRREAREKVEV